MKICFVAQHIYPYLSNFSEAKTAGGAELQQLFIGTELKKIGYEVSYICMDYGQPDGEIHDDTKVFKTFEPEEGVFGIRFFYPRLFKIWAALKRADADVYYIRSATFLVGIVALFCRKYRKKFIYAGALVTDFIPGQHRTPTKRDEWLYTYGLARADAVIVQSEEQQRLLADNFGRKSTVIRNFSPHTVGKMCNRRKGDILWVSTLRPWKRADWFMGLAGQFPGEHFVMIGGQSFGNEKLYKDLKQKARGIDNLDFLGFQPYNVTETYFDRSKIFVNTSAYEGFPNTFLQAWRRGIPVISHVDPDHVIEKNNLGIVVESKPDFEKGLSQLLKYFPRNTQHIVNYFINNHSSLVLEKYDEIFRGQCSANSFPIID